VLRRTVLLAAFVGLAALLLLAVPPRVPRTGLEAVRGHRVFRVGRRSVRRLEVAIGERTLAAQRMENGWTIDGQRATAATAEALSDLCDTLVRLRAVDVFRPQDDSTYGLDQPRGRIAVTTHRRVRRLVLGGFNAAGSAVYARVDADPRIVQVGTLLLSGVERVLYHHDVSRSGAAVVSATPAG
jgi:hypothetical protein